MITDNGVGYYLLQMLT